MMGAVESTGNKAPLFQLALHVVRTAIISHGHSNSYESAHTMLRL
jgi:hypothetical protein